MYIELIRDTDPEKNGEKLVEDIIDLLMGAIPNYPLIGTSDSKQPIFSKRRDWENYRSHLRGEKRAATGVGFYDTSKKLEKGSGFSTASRFGKSPFDPEEEEAHRRKKESLEKEKERKKDKDLKRQGSPKV